MSHNANLNMWTRLCIRVWLASDTTCNQWDVLKRNRSQLVSNNSNNPAAKFKHWHAGTMLEPCLSLKHWPTSIEEVCETKTWRIAPYCTIISFEKLHLSRTTRPWKAKAKIPATALAVQYCIRSVPCLGSVSLFLWNCSWASKQHEEFYNGCSP